MTIIKNQALPRPGPATAHDHTSTLPYYTVPDDRIGMGASLGNSALWVTTKGTGAVERVFCLKDGECLVNSITIRYAGTGSPLHHLWDASVRHTQGDIFVPLRHETPGTFEIHPAYQRHHF